MAGDNCLIKIVEVINQCCGTNLELVISQYQDALPLNSPPEYFVARYGGEEFMILMPNVTKENAIALGTNIQQAVRTLAIPQTKTNSQEHPKQIVTVSMGIVSLIPSPIMQPINLITKAYEAIQKAKIQGGDRYCTSN